MGIDPSVEQLSSWGLPSSAEGAKTFAFAILDGVGDEVGIVKPQVSFFEQFGHDGFKALSDVLEEATSRKLLVIADAKRGDIGSTMEGYAKAWLGQEAVFSCDALTVSPYLGPESLERTIASAMDNQRGLFILAATSNPEAQIVQAAESNGRSVAKIVFDYAASHSQGELGSVGVVLGATVEAIKVGIDLSAAPKIPMLVPGFGSQGVSLSRARSVLQMSAPASICSVSRSVAGASRQGLSDRIRLAKSELEVGLQ